MKNIILFLVFTLLATPCFAQHTDVFEINDFSKMLQSQVSPYLVPKNAAVEARNVRSNDVFGSLAKRKEMLSYGSIGSFDVTSLHRYYKANGTDLLLATGSTFIKLGDDDAGTFTTLRDELTTGLRWDWVTYKDIAIGCNGTDRCQKYDGHTQTTADTDGSRTASILTADFGAPFAELNTGTDLDASSWYQYVVASYNGTSYSYSTARSNPIKTGASVYNIALTGVPLGPSGTTARYVYRTLGNASRTDVEADTTFYWVGTLSDNTTTTFSDTVTDATADDDAAPTWANVQVLNITPPIAKFITLHKNRIFLAHVPDLTSHIYWSLSFYPEVFDVSDYDYVRPDDGDSITFLQEQLGNVIIGKTNTITNFDTQNAEDSKWKFYTFSHIGCPAPYSAAKSPLGIIYLGWDGIYIYNGQVSQLVSDAVTAEIRDILVSNLSEVSGVYFQSEYQLAYTSEASGSSINDVVLILDTVRDAYVLDDKNINCFEVFDSGSDSGTLYSGSSDTDGNVFAHESGGSNVVLRYKSDANEGTKDSIIVSGTENDPEMSIGWGIYINNATMSAVTLDSATYAAATINRDDTSGTWWSPAYEVNASDYSKLYWNETLGVNGNATFAIRSAATESAVTADSLSWSSEVTDPSGSDLSGETANVWLQIRASLSTTDIQYTPTLDSTNNYIFKLLYSKVGSGAETSVLSLWESGYLDLGAPTLPKRIWGIDVYYTSTSGTLTFGLETGEGDTSTSFDIDLSVDPDSDTEDQYWGHNEYKIYKWLPPIDGTSNFEPIGRTWKFSVEETGDVVWNIYKIIVKFSKEEYYEQ